MREMINIIALVLVLICSSAMAENLLSQPESIAFDTIHNRYLVSNIMGADIIQIENDFVTQSYYKRALGTYCAGNHIVNDILFTSVFPNFVKGYDMRTDELVADLVIPSASSLDGITSDTSGNLYVVDTQMKRIFRIRLSDYVCSLFVIGLPASPQDIVFDKENNRILVCCWTASSAIKAVSLPNGVVTTVVTTPMGYLDGIARDDQGNTYISSHANDGRVYRYSPSFTNPPELITTLPLEPTGLIYNARDKILAIPSYGADKIDFLSFNDVDGDGILDYQDNCPNDYNPGQEDADNDGHGDLCDKCPGYDDNADADSDGVPDACDICQGFDDNIDTDIDGLPDGCDNCPANYNPGQEDADSDGHGDLCDKCPGFDDNADVDSDGVPDACDICQGFDDKIDTDGDGYPDGCDNCPAVYNPGQEDSNGNGVGDLCDYICGDANGNGTANALDITFLINHLYKHGPAPNPPQSGDVNHSGTLNALDITYLINYLYKHGPALNCP